MPCGVYSECNYQLKLLWMCVAVHLCRVVSYYHFIATCISAGNKAQRSLLNLCFMDHSSIQATPLVTGTQHTYIHCFSYGVFLNSISHNFGDQKIFLGNFAFPSQSTQRIKYMMHCIMIMPLRLGHISTIKEVNLSI